MIADLSLKDIAAACGAVWNGADLMCTGVAIDSRRVGKGDLFVALPGERVDGHDFLAECRRAGAVAAVVETADEGLDWPQLVVSSAREALAAIAGLNRERFRGILVALTGSCGKTTCRNMLAAILGLCGSTHATAGNYNNEIGVPLTLLALAAEHEFAVIEMGARQAGDIHYLTGFCRPDIAFVTNARSAHLEGFGSLSGVVTSKGEIYQDLGSEGFAIINIDEPGAISWQVQSGAAQSVTVSLSNPRARVFATDIRIERDVTRFTLNTGLGRVGISLAAPGEHMISNALMAAAAAMSAGADMQAVAAGLARFSPEPGRMQRFEWRGIDLIDDSYNANPASVEAAIRVLSSGYSSPALVLGTMADLGADAAQLHLQIARKARESGLRSLLLLSDHADAMAAEFGAGAVVFRDRPELLAFIGERFSEWDVILVKGSRSAEMDRIVAALQRDAGEIA